MEQFQILQASAHPDILPGKNLTGCLAFPSPAVQVLLHVLAGKRPKKKERSESFSDGGYNQIAQSRLNQTEGTHTNVVVE